MTHQHASLPDSLEAAQHLIDDLRAQNAELRRALADREELEEALRRSRESYQSFVSQSHEAIYCTEFDQPIDTSLPVEEQIDAIYDNAYMGVCNQAMAAMYGLPSADSFIGQRLVDFHGGQDNAVNRATFRAFIDAGYRTVDCETEEVTPEGEQRFFQTSDIGIVENGRLLRIWGTATDITTRKRVEGALRESEERFRLLAQNMPILINAFDAQGAYVFWNAECELVSGYSAAEIVGNPQALDLLYPDPVHRQRLVDEWRARGSHFRDWETVVTTRSGEQRTVSWSNISDRCPIPGWQSWAIGIDVTERIETQAELVRASEMLVQISRLARVGGWEKNLITGSDHWSDVTKEIHEVPLDFVPNMQAGIDFYREGEHRDRITQVVQRAIEDGTPFDVELQIVTAQGNLRWVRALGAAEFLAGRCVRLYGAFQDIDDRKRAEAEREKLQEQLVQARKMESIGRLAGGVAHDFNNMLGVVLGHAELAMQQLHPADPLHADLSEIRLAAQRSAELTRQLLAFARKQVVAPRVLDLNDVIAATIQMLRRLIGETIELAWRPGTALWLVKIDPAQITQILVNLCANARDAIDGTGHITLETENVVCDESYCAGQAGFAPGSYVLLAVSDDGRGMDREQLQHLFEPFYTTKEVGQGTGLGLATVHGAVTQNQGIIHVYSEPGHGTTFKIYLPRFAGQPSPLTRDRNPMPGRETVLLVEDEAAVLNMSRTVLERLGYTVLAASLPAEALRLAGEYAGQIHILVTDVVMPEMNGRELATCLQPFHPTLKCLFMSGYTANVIAHHGVLDEGVAFLQKPFTIEDLAAKLREVLDSSQ